MKMMSEAILQVAANFEVIADQVASQNQQVDEIEFSGAPLQGIVLNYELPHFFAERGCEIGLGGSLELVQFLQQMLARSNNLFARHSIGEKPGAFLQVLPEIPREMDEKALERVVIAGAGRLGALNPGH